MNPPGTPTPTPRTQSIDLLRGLAIVLMALDHTRDYFHRDALLGLSALDVEHTTLVTYATRWVTHLCAPTFVFLAGVSAFLRGGRGGSRAELSRFLATRGLWLIVLELTIIDWFGWSFDITFDRLSLMVIWALGVSMIVLSALVWLPRWAIALFGLALVLGHNLTDAWTPTDWGPLAPLWRILHVPGVVDEWTAARARVVYPLVPWLGVMALGYALGPIARTAPDVRRRWLALIGLGALGLFVVLRATNLYGNPDPWAPRPDFVSSVGVFLDCAKYPPSLQFLLVTLGMAFLVWWCFEHGTPRPLRFLLAFGATPLFTYVVHLPLIHGLAVGVHELFRSDGGWLVGFDSPTPDDAGFGLWVGYAAWSGVLLLLHPMCRRVADLKRRRRGDWWLGYL